jgi:hypothetical protein
MAAPCGRGTGRFAPLAAPMSALSPSIGTTARGEPMRATPGIFDRFAALSGASNRPQRRSPALTRS